MLSFKMIIITAFLIVAALTATSKDLISVQPTTITNLVDTKIVFTFRDGITIDVFNLKPVLNGVDDSSNYCVNPSSSGQSKTCTVKFGVGVYKFKYYDILQDDIILTVEKVKLLSITPTTTLTSDKAQEVTLTFNRLPLPSVIKYGSSFTKPIASCTPVSGNSLQLTCQVTYNTVEQSEFFLDAEAINIKIDVIDKASLILKSITPNATKQSLEAQKVKLEFETVLNDMTTLNKIVYIGDESPSKCEMESTKIYNCDVILKAPGEKMIFFGGINTGVLISILSTSISSYYSLSFITILSLIILS